mmetsp:Transcript_27471/g.87354  ORF Transcript_27471/g.87354 Transcript_27471/m.87354 type:complete len:365 (+) Transcript_27471:521-1615(+)
MPTTRSRTPFRVDPNLARMLLILSALAEADQHALCSIQEVHAHSIEIAFHGHAHRHPATQVHPALRCEGEQAAIHQQRERAGAQGETAGPVLHDAVIEDRLELLRVRFVRPHVHHHVAVRVQGAIPRHGAEHMLIAGYAREGGRRDVVVFKPDSGHRRRVGERRLAACIIANPEKGGLLRAPPPDASRGVDGICASPCGHNVNGLSQCDAGQGERRPIPSGPHLGAGWVDRAPHAPVTRPDEQHVRRVLQLDHPRLPHDGVVQPDAEQAAASQKKRPAADVHVAVDRRRPPRLQEGDELVGGRGARPGGRHVRVLPGEARPDVHLPRLPGGMGQGRQVPVERVQLHQQPVHTVVQPARTLWTER